MENGKKFQTVSKVYLPVIILCMQFTNGTMKNKFQFDGRWVSCQLTFKFTKYTIRWLTFHPQHPLIVERLLVPSFSWLATELGRCLGAGIPCVHSLNFLNAEQNWFTFPLQRRMYARLFGAYHTIRQQNENNERKSSKERRNKERKEKR